MECKYCKGKCQKAGKQNSGTQKLYCKLCQKYQQASYLYNACGKQVNEMISTLVCESVSIRGIARVLKIASATVTSKIKRIARAIEKPYVLLNQPAYEVDELMTYIRKKQNRHCVVYAICCRTKAVIDFAVGRRNKTTLNKVISTLLLSNAGCIKTDNYSLYRLLIPPAVHDSRAYQTNHIERKNLNIRTHLKRLARKTICYTKSIVMLKACLRIYFWGSSY